MYDAYYKLKSKPFQLSPDPRFFFNSQGHKRALAYLRYGINQGEGFIIITGDIGTGKTLLVRTLFNELKDDNIVAGQLVTTQVEADDMLRLVASTFGLAHDGIPKSTLLKNLETFFRARHQEGKRVLLVVDEVQNLPMSSVEELRMLSNFEINGRPLLQSFLLGQEEFRATLQSDELEQLRQRVIAAYHLSPLDEKETRAYIEHRLKMADWKNDPEFTEDSFAAIHKATDGVPRRINSLCDRLMLYGYLEEMHKLDRKAVESVAKEIHEETVKPAAIKNKAAQTRAARKMAENKAAAAPAKTNGNAAAAAAPLSGNAEDRIARLEEMVSSLEKTVKKERQLLRKALLFSLDLDEDGRPLDQ